MTFMRSNEQVIVMVLAVLASACSSQNGTTTPNGTSTLSMQASVTLNAQQATQPEQIFLYAFPLPAGQQSLLGLHGVLSMSSPTPTFNEALITVATIASSCPQSGTVYSGYTTLFAALPSLVPVQGFILKDPNQGTANLTVSFQLPVGLPVSNCMVLLLDWEGGAAVTMSSTLSMTYAAAASPSTAELLSTNQEFVFGENIGPGSTTNDSLQFVQEALVPQAGTILALLGDISDSPYGGVPAPSGSWQVLNDIYLVPGGCPSQIPVNASNYTDTAGHYSADIPPTAQHLLSVPLSGVGQVAATRAVYQQMNVAVQQGDCLLTVFGLNAPNGGGMDAETQVQALFQPGG